MQLPMTPALAVLGLSTAALIMLVLVLRPSRGTRAELADGVQKVDVVVKGHYRPDVIVARRGIPLRLSFIRREDDVCSERVIFAGFKINRYLPPFATTEVEILPDHTGDFLFTCQMGMYHGRLLVRESDSRTGSI